MGKKKNKKKNKYEDLAIMALDDISMKKSKKSLDKDFKRAIKEIENMRYTLYEADKLTNKKDRRKINQKEKEFYTDMESVKARKKMAKKWKKSGFLDSMIQLLNEISPFIKMLAKGLCMLIIAFLSLDSIKRIISPEILCKISTVFHLANSI